MAEVSKLTDTAVERGERGVDDVAERAADALADAAHDPLRAAINVATTLAVAREMGSQLPAARDPHATHKASDVARARVVRELEARAEKLDVPALVEKVRERWSGREARGEAREATALRDAALQVRREPHGLRKRSGWRGGRPAWPHRPPAPLRRTPQAVADVAEVDARCATLAIATEERPVDAQAMAHVAEALVTFFAEKAGAIAKRGADALAELAGGDALHAAPRAASTLAVGAALGARLASLARRLDETGDEAAIAIQRLTEASASLAPAKIGGRADQGRPAVGRGQGQRQRQGAARGRPRLNRRADLPPSDIGGAWGRRKADDGGAFGRRSAADDDGVFS